MANEITSIPISQSAVSAIKASEFGLLANAFCKDQGKWNCLHHVQSTRLHYQVTCYRLRIHVTALQCWCNVVLDHEGPYHLWIQTLYFMGGRHYWSLIRICKKTSDIVHCRTSCIPAPLETKLWHVPLIRFHLIEIEELHLSTFCDWFAEVCFPFLFTESG